MAEYQRIEYQITPDGRITERVLGGQGASCLTTTVDLEKAIGQVEHREKLPEFEDDPFVETQIIRSQDFQA